MNKANLIKLIKYIYLFLALLFLSFYLYKDFDEISKLELRFNILFLLLSFIFYFLYKLGQSLIWYYITKKNNCTISLYETIESWYISQLGRYIPGKVFYLGGRLYYYKKHGINISLVTYSFFLENVLSLVAALIVLLFSMYFIISRFHIGFNWSFSGIIFIALLTLLIIIHPKIFQKVTNFILSKFNKNQIEIVINYKSIIIVLFMYALNWLLIGSGFTFLIATTTEIDLSFSLFLFFTGSFSFSVMMGIISFFAPSGIGVREFFLILLLKEVTGYQTAIVVSLISRFWVILGDIVLIGNIYLLLRWLRRETLVKG